MAEAKWCSHDSRGRQVGLDEFPEIATNYSRYLSGNLGNYSHLDLSSTALANCRQYSNSTLLQSRCYYRTITVTEYP